jgi:hypothetical protein
MARFMPYADEPLRKVFLHDATSDADCERLKEKAERFEEWCQKLKLQHRHYRNKALENPPCSVKGPRAP